MGAILALISSLTVGGILGSIVGIGYLKKRERAKAQQEVEQATNLELTNIRNLIELYNKALEDSKNILDSTKSSYENKIRQLENTVQDLTDKVGQYTKQVQENEDTIDKLTRSQLKLKVQLQSLTNLDNSDCQKCQFKDTCEKYKAKKILNEQTDAEGLLSNE
jgi:type II secretory pathway pseudopilin PulG